MIPKAQILAIATDRKLQPTTVEKPGRQALLGKAADRSRRGSCAGQITTGFGGSALSAALIAALSGLATAFGPRRRSCRRPI